MELSVVLATAVPERAWSAARLANHSLDAGDNVGVFLLGEGVEAIRVSEPHFEVRELLTEFAARGGTLMACGTCLNRREDPVPEVYEVSAMEDLRQLIERADKVVNF